MDKHTNARAAGGMAESSTPTGAYTFRKRTRAAIKEDDDSAGSEDDSSGALLSEHDPTVEGGAVSDESIDEEARTTRGRAGKAAVKRRVVVKETPKKEPGTSHVWRRGHEADEMVQSVVNPRRTSRRRRRDRRCRAPLAPSRVLPSSRTSASA